MSEWNGTFRLSWRLGVVISLSGAILTGTYFAGGFITRAGMLEGELLELKLYSQEMGLQVGKLLALDAADNAGDRAVEARLEKIEDVVVRIENWTRTNSQYRPSHPSRIE